MKTKWSLAFWFETKIQNTLAYFYLVADYLRNTPCTSACDLPAKFSQEIIVPDRNTDIYHEALEMTYLNGPAEIVSLLGAKYFEPLAHVEHETNTWPPIKRHASGLKTMLDNLDGIAEYLVKTGSDEVEGLNAAETAVLLRAAFQARRVELLTNPGAKSFISYFLEKKYTMFLAPKDRLAGTSED